MSNLNATKEAVKSLKETNYHVEDKFQLIY